MDLATLPNSIAVDGGDLDAEEWIPIKHEKGGKDFSVKANPTTLGERGRMSERLICGLPDCNSLSWPAFASERSSGSSTAKITSYCYRVLWRSLKH